MTRRSHAFNPPKVLFWLTFAYAALLAALSVLNWMGAELLWLGALNLYLPQVMWAAPGVVLALLFFRYDRRRIWLPLVCVLWVLGPIMGFCWSPPAAKPEAGSVTLRVMTWNIKYGYYSLTPLIEEIERRKPDLVLFQDAVRAMKGPLGDYFKGWQVRSLGQYVVASRYPLSEAEWHELPSYSRKEENFLRCRMRVGKEEVVIYNVHLKTPRRSLNAFRTARRQPWNLPQAIDYLHQNVTLRLAQARTLQGSLSREKGAVLLAGDLNATEASRVCKTLQDAGLRDAFSESGTGYGFTYGHLLLKNRVPWFRVSWMRIDHIMVNSRFVTQRCLAGSGKASDHRPVIADLVLTPAAAPTP